jgi:predicted permease
VPGAGGAAARLEGLPRRPLSAVGARKGSIVRIVKASLRALGRQPWFSAIAIATLALGIGANTAMFSVLRTVLLRPLPVEDQDRLVMIWTRNLQRDQQVAEVSLGEFRAWRERNETFESVAIQSSVLWSLTIAAPGTPAQASHASVSSDFFRTLGAEALVGRTFRDHDDREGAPRTAVLSEGLWRRRFGGDPAVIGRSFTAGEGKEATAVEIVGVMPATFDLPRGAELWTSATPDLEEAARDSKEGLPLNLRVYYGVGRLKAGVDTERARADLDRVSRAWFASQRVPPLGEATVLTPLIVHLFGSARPALYALMGAVGVVLLIACANVASLQLARGLARRREVAVRLSLGATRGQVFRHLLVESAGIAAAGGIAGVALAAISLNGLIALSPAEIPRLDETALDGWVFAFAVAASAATAVLVGLAPAWQLSRTTLVTVLNETGRAGASVRGRTREMLVVAEVALTVVLLVAAGLMVQSFIRLARLDLGFDPDNVLTFQIGGPASTFATPEQQRTLVDRLIAGYERTPGVRAAGAVYLRPFEHGPIGMDSLFILPAQYEAKQEHNPNPILNWQSVTPGYFRAMDIALVRGRAFDDRDVETSPPVVIVSQALADRVWPGQEPIGQRLRAYGAEGRWQTVVGVVETARYREIDTSRLDLYLPHRQAPSPVQYIVVRAADEPTRLTAALRHATASVDSELTIDGVTTMTRIVERTRGPWRFNMLVFGAFGGVAVLLAAMGLFGLVAYAVSQRTREIGVRMAVGASGTDVVRLMVRAAARLALAGLAIGLVVAFAVTRLVSGLLFGVTPTDAPTFAAVAVGLLAVAMLASYVPARRAARVDPLVALRAD